MQDKITYSVLTNLTALVRYVKHTLVKSFFGEADTNIHDKEHEPWESGLWRQIIKTGHNPRSEYIDLVVLSYNSGTLKALRKFRL